MEQAQMVTGSHKKVLRLGEVLVKQGVATTDQIDIALTEQKKSRELLGKIQRPWQIYLAVVLPPSVLTGPLLFPASMHCLAWSICSRDRYK